MSESAPFELLEVVGRGSMGTVWRARTVPGGDIVAVKMLHPHLLEDREYLARFEREVELTQRVHSPYVVRTLAFGKLDGAPYLVMEYCPWGTLRSLLHKQGALPYPTALMIVAGIAKGLDAIHSVGITHRDVKPSNVLLDTGFSPKLTDFGVAKASDLTRLTSTAGAVGTVAYMPPESSPGPQGDFYSLGCVLYEMLSGAPPFDGESYHQVFVRQLNEAPDLSRVDPAARPLLSWLLAKNPASRPSSARALLDVIEGRRSVPEGASPAPTSTLSDSPAALVPGPPSPQRELGRALLIAGGSVTGLVLLGLILALILGANAGEPGAPHLTPRTVPVNLFRFTKDNMYLEIQTMEVLPNGNLRVHELVTNRTGVDGWRWIFDNTGGTFIEAADKNHVIPVRWSLSPGEISEGAPATTTLKNNESREIWVEFLPFVGMDGTFAYYDSPLEFLNLSLSSGK